MAGALDRGVGRAGLSCRPRRAPRRQETTREKDDDDSDDVDDDEGLNTCRHGGFL